MILLVENWPVFAVDSSCSDCRSNPAACDSL
jgi:hypothetical protein